VVSSRLSGQGGRSWSLPAGAHIVARRTRRFSRVCNETAASTQGGSPILRADGWSTRGGPQTGT
jgi:hypothetical protein